MGDQPTDHLVGYDDVSQVPRTVQRVKPGRYQPWRVPDVVQPGGYLHHLRLFAQHPAELVGPTANTLRVGPASRQLLAQQTLRE